MNAMKNKSIFLADDDADDCMLFEDALREVSNSAELVTVNDGMELMSVLDETVPPSPDVIFLDLNMPRKNGFECLIEIRGTQRFKDIPVVIFSTSAQEEAITRVYEEGANYYIRKPGSFPKLKTAIKHVLSMDWSQNKPTSYKDNFFFQF
jgi:CheY-like chemotaxis protein